MKRRHVGFDMEVRWWFEARHISTSKWTNFLAVRKQNLVTSQTCILSVSLWESSTWFLKYRWNYKRTSSYFMGSVIGANGGQNSVRLKRCKFDPSSILNIPMTKCTLTAINRIHSNGTVSFKIQYELPTTQRRVLTGPSVVFDHETSFSRLTDHSHGPRSFTSKYSAIRSSVVAAEFFHSSISNSNNYNSNGIKIKTYSFCPPAEIATIAGGGIKISRQATDR